MELLRGGGVSMKYVTAVVGVVLLFGVHLGDSLMFQLQPNGKKCLGEEIHKDVLVSGDYEVTEVPGQVVELSVSFGFYWSRR
jgi:hypothetical protein